MPCPAVFAPNAKGIAIATGLIYVTAAMIICAWAGQVFIIMSQFTFSQQTVLPAGNIPKYQNMVPAMQSDTYVYSLPWFTMVIGVLLIVCWLVEPALILISIRARWFYPVILGAIFAATGVQTVGALIGATLSLNCNVNPYCWPSTSPYTWDINRVNWWWLTYFFCQIGIAFGGAIYLVVVLWLRQLSIILVVDETTLGHVQVNSGKCLIHDSKVGRIVHRHNNEQHDAMVSSLTQYPGHVSQKVVCVGNPFLFEFYDAHHIKTY